VSKIKTASASIPGLDGLRALAVVVVILYHLFPHIFPGGYIGVDIFFVISGFLITTLLIGEYEKTGRINLKHFWLRRTRRLLPALFATILVIGSIVFFVRGDILVGLGRQIFGAATFSSNWIEVLAGTNYFDGTTPHLFLNFWSLAVEEQFYLVWPFLVIAIVLLKKPRIGIVLALLFILASASWMTYLFTHNADATRVYYGTDTHLFGLMIGALLAFWSQQQHVGQASRRFSQHFWSLRRIPTITLIISLMALAALLYLTFTLSDQTSFAYKGGLLLASTLSAILIVCTISVHTLLQRVLSTSPLKWIGVRSYGLYLWHWPLIVIAGLVLPMQIKSWALPVSVSIATLLAATISYRFVETPVRQRGFKAVAKRAITHKYINIDASTIHIRRRPHSLAIAGIALVVLTLCTVISAPTKTSAQLSIEKGQAALKQQTAAKPSPLTPHLTVNHVPIHGSDITAVGDSVMLASSPALQAHFPGIYIDAEVSRSLRGGGFDTVGTLQAAGQLRKVVVVALGTNGYYGSGKLDELVSQLKDHEIVLVAAHADREWITPNNDDARALAQTNKDIAFAEWDQAITPHPDLLSTDGIHPNADGGIIYATCIQMALKKFE
jgi:peptidoglycan/LPS O-acetylase OafA/YrhL